MQQCGYPYIKKCSLVLCPNGLPSLLGGVSIVFVKRQSRRVIDGFVVLEHGVENIAAASGEADEGGVVLFPSARFGRSRCDWRCRAARRTPRGTGRV